MLVGSSWIEISGDGRKDSLDCGSFSGFSVGGLSLFIDLFSSLFASISFFVEISCSLIFVGISSFFMEAFSSLIEGVSSFCIELFASLISGDLSFFNNLLASFSSDSSSKIRSES